VLPQEKLLQAIPDLPLTELHARGWPRFKVEGPIDRHGSLRPLVRSLRNAVAHFNIQFQPGGDQSISGVILTNRDLRRGTVGWKAWLPLEDLRQLVDCFSDLILEELEAAPERTPR
jgi:hypothetical protein